MIVALTPESLCSRPAEFDAADRCQLDRAGNRRYRSRQRSSPGGELRRPRPERRPGGSDGKNTQIKLRSESDGDDEPELMFLFTSTGHLQEAVPVPRQDR